MWKNVKDELPTNTFECIVKMWNKFSDTWVVGIGIYDVPTEQWEIQYNGVVLNYPVHFWFKTPEFEEGTKSDLVNIRSCPQSIINILKNVTYWDTCPDDYKITIGKYLKKINKT
jgi:hypothetical protein